MATATAAAMLVLALAALAGPAAAHAILQQVTPSDGATLDAAPQQVTLQFNEEVTTPASGIRVYDSDGERVDTGTAGAGDEPGQLAVPLRADLGEGTYVVSWRAVSADGHPLRGAWLFTVGDVQADDSLLAEMFSSDADRGAAIAAVAVRWMLYVATFIAGGGAVALARLVPEAGDRRQRVLQIVRVGAVAALALTVVGVFTQAAVVTGLGARAVASPRALTDVATSGYGTSTAVRAAACLAILWFTGRRGRGYRVAAVVGALALASFALEGHTVTTSPVWLAFSAGVVHLIAAGVWTGGLLALAAAIGRSDVRAEPVRAARLVGGFSALATWSILGVAIAGVALGWLEVRALRALTTTNYGWTLIAKLVALIPVAAAALYNNRRLVPTVARAASGGGYVTDPGRPIPAGGSDDGPVRTALVTTGDEDQDTGGPLRPSPASGAFARLRRILALEIVGVLVVLAVTAVLVGLQPAADAAGVSGAYSTYVPLGDDHELNLTVDPNRVGVNEIHMYVLGSDGRQADVASDVVVALRQPERDLGPLRRETTRLGPGHFLLSGPELSVPGTWEIEVEVPISRFDQLRATVPVTVNPA